MHTIEKHWRGAVLALAVSGLANAFTCPCRRIRGRALYSAAAVQGPAVASTGAELPPLSHDEIMRYSRHLILEDVGVLGQRRLKASSVVCVGTGGLGSPLLLYLAAAGIGRIGIIDNDVVDLSNLQRQIIHSQSTLGRPKVESAKQRMLEVNPHITVETYQELLDASNVLDILAPYDIVVDGSDNFPTRYLVNDACVMLNKPLVYGAILRFEGQASVFNYKGGPNYRDLLPEPPPPGAVPSCAEGGVLGVLPGVIGGIQATEVIKLITGIGEPLTGRVLIYDALLMRMREVGLPKNPDAKPIQSLIDYHGFCGGPSSPEAEEAPATPFEHLSARQAATRLQEGWVPYVLDVRLPQEGEIVGLPFTDRLCPHREVADIADKLPKNRDILVFCKAGGRSKQACRTLAELGFGRLYNLEGGITAWAQDVDGRLPTY